MSSADAKKKVKELIEKGKEKGVLTYKEIMDARRSRSSAGTN